MNLLYALDRLGCIIKSSKMIISDSSIQYIDKEGLKINDILLKVYKKRVEGNTIVLHLESTVGKDRFYLFIDKRPIKKLIII